MLRKIAIGLIAVALAWLGGRALVWKLASDETQIRWKLEDACEGFSETRMTPILDFLAREFVDDPSGYHRDDMRASAAGLFFSEKDPKTKKFPYRAVIVPDTFSAEIDPAGNRGQVHATIRITDMRGDGRVAWEFALDGQVARGDDGWQLVRTMHYTREGRPGLGDR